MTRCSFSLTRFAPLLTKNGSKAAKPAMPPSSIHRIGLLASDLIILIILSESLSLMIPSIRRLVLSEANCSR
ncbi:MAG: hypothetical protein ACD_47C00260G0002 [uncultured bacterium]|nr:MAG: hypothetical protein ACD_47C00260G0002 [uncultured bacterium]